MSKIVETVAHAFNTANPRHLAEAYARDARFTNVFFPATIVGVDAIITAETPMFDAFSDIRWQLVDLVEAPGKVAVEYTMDCVNSGPLPTPGGIIPATHRPLRLRAVSFLALDADGRIAEERRYFDTASMMHQLGLM